MRANEWKVNQYREYTKLNGAYFFVIAIQYILLLPRYSDRCGRMTLQFHFPETAPNVVTNKTNRKALIQFRLMGERWSDAGLLVFLLLLVQTDG